MENENREEILKETVIKKKKKIKNKSQNEEKYKENDENNKISTENEKQNLKKVWSNFISVYNICKCLASRIHV